MQVMAAKQTTRFVVFLVILSATLVIRDIMVFSFRLRGWERRKKNQAWRHAGATKVSSMRVISPRRRYNMSVSAAVIISSSRWTVGWSA